MKQHQLVAKLVHHLHTRHADLKPDELRAGATCLAHVFDSEEFPMSRNDFLPPEAKKQLLDFNGLFLKALIGDSAEIKKQVRPLLDVIVRCGG